MSPVSPASSTPTQPKPLGPLAHWPVVTTIPLLAGSIGDALRRHATARGERTAILWEGAEGLQRMSYAKLLVKVENLARWLLERAAPGDRVALWSKNNLESVVLQHASAMAGTILTPFNTSWTDFEVRHALDLVQPRVWFVGQDTRGISLLERATALVEDRVLVGIDDLLKQQARSQTPLPDVAADAPFLIQFTSGTTGRAKGAVLSHRAALNGGYLRPATDGANDSDVWLNPVPLHHVGGSCSIVLGALSVGGAYAVMDRHDTDITVRLLQPTGATRIGGVPTMLMDLLNHPQIAAGGFKHSIRVISVGGASVPPSLIQRIIRELGATPAIGYGQSECPIITSTSMHDDVDTIATTVGRPAFHAEVKIVDPTTRETLKLGEIGEVCVRSQLIMSGYYGMPEATAETIDADGFLHTGDLGSMDSNGIMRIHGRAREVIIRGGENIYPAEVEDALLRHPAVQLAAVIGVDDEKWGQQVAAVVQLRPGQQATPEDLRAFAAQRVAHFKIPRYWHFVSGMPMTASGKIRKVELEARFKATGSTS